MSWKKAYARPISFKSLPEIGAFRICERPEALGDGKYRVKLELENETYGSLVTYESTIGAILSAQGKDDSFIRAVVNRVGNKDYLQFVPAQQKLKP